MACQYYVGGRWVSENEFKAILNDGLLDTLVANNQLDLKNFKVDSSKVRIAETKIVERTTVPATKLAEILAQEIKNRQGYALNMLSALELNKDKTDFKIPLWASPYKDKFESLLTSLVSNKVVKQKFTGNSYVLGSEEGFRVKEGDAAAGDLKNSSIVFSSKFDPTKGLQPMRYDRASGKILPAQIMIPFKFRNERGEILNLDEFITIDKDGRKLLDTDKIPEKLLQLFGFRIPTQERNSMAAVEIVGFLPEAMGDLMLAPRDFTKQMGSDFDVDKLYTYMYNHFYSDGKLYTNFLSDPKKIKAQIKLAKETLRDFRKSLQLTKEENKIIKDYIKNTIDSNEEGDDIDETLAKQANEIISKNIKLGDAKKTMNMLLDRISVLNRSYKASRQNKILDIHLDIMTSTNPEIIASIIALDSFGEFSDLATTVNEARSARGANPTPITILSDIYQRTKYINATAGKNGVGSFSLDSTFNAIAQGKDLVLKNLSPEAEVEAFGTFQNPRIPTAQELMELNDPVATFGDVVSKGDLSNKYTLRSQAIINKAKAEKRELTKEERESLKYKSSIIRALQSTAVDNEKEQILDKLNINDDTFPAIRAMALLGFEEEDIAGLITQDIVWEYLDKLKLNRSTLSTYNSNFEEELMAELTAKYDPQGLLEKATGSTLEQYQKLGDVAGKDLIANLSKAQFNPKLSTDFNLQQLMILNKFKRLTEIGTEIKKVQSAINTESSGVPKTLLETSTKVRQIENIKYSSVFNAASLLGVFENGVLQPKTVNGFAAQYGTVFADQIYRKYFPYKSQGFTFVLDEVLSHIAKGDAVYTSAAKLTEAQQELFADINSYFYSNSKTNLFDGNPDGERARLFMEVEGKNTSLAGILQALKGESWYQRNGFLNKLTPKVNTNGTVSRINFEASTAANFDERNIYEGFTYLLSKNVPIGEFNGIQYTTRTLAQDLVAAAFLEGGTQGAKQYLKYVPIAYLKTLGFGEYLQNIPFSFENSFGGKLDGDGHILYSMPSDFTRQFIQNNPDKVKTISLADTGSKTIPQQFALTGEALQKNFVQITDPATGDMTQTQTHFVAIKDDKAKSELALYEFNEATRQYNRIPTLQGSFGFTQYNSQLPFVTPIQKQEKVASVKPEVTAPGTTIKGIPVKPVKSFDPNVINNTVKDTEPSMLGINTTLSGKEALDEVISKMLQDDSVSSLNKILLDKLQSLEFPEKFNFTFTKDKGMKGNYDYSSQTLTYNLNHPTHTDANQAATTLAHELIHVFTGQSIRDYLAGNLDKLNKEQVDAIDSLKALQLTYIEYLNQEGKLAELQKFMDNYKIWSAADPKTRGSFATADSISQYYGAVKLSEFVTMALTDQGFQAYLNNVKINDKSLWSQIKDLLLDIINAMGLDVKPGTALSAAVKESMNLIDAGQSKEIFDDVFFKPAEGIKATMIGFGQKTKSDIQTQLEAAGYRFYQDPDGTYDLEQKEDGIIGERIATLEEALRIAQSDLQKRTQTTKPTAEKAPTESKFTYEGRTIDTEFVLTAGQDAALKRLVDFSKSDDKFITLQGAAGTGKTAVIGYLQKYLGTDANFVYMAPTHAATAELAFATVKSGNKKLPMTVQSAFRKSVDTQTGKEQVGATKKLKDRLGYTDNIIVIDEVSMLSAKEYALIKEAVKNQDIKVIYMGDIKQIPEVDTTNPTLKQVSKAFTDNEQVLLSEVKRTESESILSVLTRLRNTQTNSIPRVTNTEEIKYLADNDYIKELVSTVKNDPENTLVISYTNRGVEETNNKIRRLLGREGSPQENDIIVGYLGYASKQIENGDIANSVRYTIDEVEKDGSAYKIIASSQKLQKLQELGVQGAVYTSHGRYLQLSPTDSFKFDDLTVEDFAKNNEVVSKVFKELYLAKQEALKNPRKWANYYAVQGDTAKFFATNLLGGDYIYNPNTGKVEQFNSAVHAAIRKNNPELYVEKGVDYGHAVTIHKSQGSTVKNVFFDATSLPKGSSSKLMQGDTQVGTELQSLIYVAMSRASEKLVVDASDPTKFEQVLGKVDFSKVSNSPELREMPTPDITDDKGGPSLDDWEAYNNSFRDDALIEQQLDEEMYQKYLLICGK